MKISPDILKYIAVITMTIDHIGYVLLPKYRIFRLIGRLSFPIFAYLISEGLKHTHDRKMYLLRMMFFAGLAQIILYYSGYTFVNVLVTYSLAIIGIFAHDKRIYGVATLAMMAACYFDVDYSYYGVGVVYLFYYLNDKKMLRNIIYILMSIIFCFQYNFKCDFSLLLNVLQFQSLTVIINCFSQVLSFLSLPLFIDLDSHELHKSKFKYKRYLFYIYYPLHLVLLKLIERGF